MRCHELELRGCFWCKMLGIGFGPTEAEVISKLCRNYVELLLSLCQNYEGIMSELLFLPFLASPGTLRITTQELADGTATVACSTCKVPDAVAHRSAHSKTSGGGNGLNTRGARRDSSASIET